MATWKKIIVSGSQASLQGVTASVSIDTPNAIGFYGTASWAQSASHAITASYAANVSSPIFTISGSTTYGTASFAANGDTLLLTGSNGLRVTVTDNSAVTTASFGLPTDAQVTLGGVTSSLFGTASYATQAATSSKVSTTATSTNQDYYIPFVANNASTLAESILIDGGLKYNPSNDSLTVAGNLTVVGTASFQSTQNLYVADQFILLGSGSQTDKDGGIIVQSAAGPEKGYAFFLNNANGAGESPRWAFSSSVSGVSTDVTPDEYVVSARKDSGTWSAAGAAPIYGSASAGYGNIVVDNNSDIWIYV